MKRIFVILTFLIAMVIGYSIPGKATEAVDQQNLVRKFITAYFNKDMPTVRTCLPSSKALLFTQYPFNGKLTLTGAKVSKKQALVEFSGPVADPQMIGKGGILLYRHGNLWQVRQVLFYNKVPRIFNLPTKSVTATDRSHEAAVSKVAKQFVEQWKANSSNGMMKLWYDWPKDKSGRVTGLTMSNFQFKNGKTRWKDPYISYTVKLAYKTGPLNLKMTAHGAMVLVKDGGCWKVRANSFFFNF